MKKLLVLLFVSIICFTTTAQINSDIAQTAGSITTQNLNPLTGVPTVGSFIRLGLRDHGTATISVNGTYTGALSVQYTIDGGNTWITITATTLVSKTSLVPTATIASAAVGAFTTDVTGLSDIRVSALAAVTGTASITIKAVQTAQQVSLTTSLPTGGNAIGNITVINGQTGHSVASTGTPLRAGGRVTENTIATLDVTLVPGDASDLAVTGGKQLIVKNFGDATLDYFFHNTSVVTNTALQVLAPSSATASVRNYITGFTYQTDVLGAAGNIWILDGQGAIGVSATIAVPGVFTSAAHDLKIGSAIVFTALGTITGVTVNTIYYISATNFTTTTFSLSLTQGGANITTTGTTSAFTFYRLLCPIRLQTTAVPFQSVVFQSPLKTIANSPVHLLIPTSLTSGNIYLTVNGYRGF